MKRGKGVSERQGGRLKGGNVEKEWGKRNQGREGKIKGGGERLEIEKRDTELVREIWAEERCRTESSRRR